MAGFDAFDYVILVGIILGSLAIGIFFGRKKQDGQEYTTSSGQMSFIPVGLSMCVSFISSNTIQGVPAEVYFYGVEFMLDVIGCWGVVGCMFTYVPLYCQVEFNSVYDYLDARFQHRAPRFVAYVAGIIIPIQYMGLTSYGPATALESVTGVETWIWILVIMGICTIYTSIGGIKAVVWTDVFQGIIMILGLLAITVFGLIELKDVSIGDELRERSRINFHVSPDPTLRLNVWILTLGSGISWLTYFAFQPAFVRFKSVGTANNARKMLGLATLGFVFLQLGAYSAGIVMFAYYSDKGCGPLAGKEINSPNQIISYYVTEVLDFPGVPGLFIAALVGASMSSISTSQNAISSIVWYDLMSHCCGEKVGEKTKMLVMKLSVVLCGCLAVGVAFASQYIGGSLIQVGPM